MSNEQDRAVRAATARSEKRGSVEAEQRIPQALYEMIEVLHSISDSLASIAARR